MVMFFAPLPPLAKFVCGFFGIALDGFVEEKGQDCFDASLLMPPAGQIPKLRFSGEVCVGAL